MMYRLMNFISRIIRAVDFFLYTLCMYFLSFLPPHVIAPFYRKLFQSWSRVFVRALNVDLRLHQKNKRPLPKQFILIANHPSAFEDIGIPSLFNVRSLAKQQVKHWWIVGRISTAANTLYFDRESKKARAEVVDRVLVELKKGDSIALYPEGGCKGRRLFESFRYGAFDMSLQSGVPIVPVFLHYESQEDFEWQGQSLPRKIWQIMTARNNRANYYVFDALDPADYANKEAFTESAYQQYLLWQEEYLE